MPTNINQNSPNLKQPGVDENSLKGGQTGSQPTRRHMGRCYGTTVFDVCGSQS
jgi:hypothetical protein